MHIVFNGWPLVTAEEPDAALHLGDLLERLPALAPRHRYTLLLPDGAAPRSWPAVSILGVRAPRGEWGRLWLEQRGLVRAAAAVGADVLYFPYAAAPISSPLPVVAWCGSAVDRRVGGGPATRLRAALAEVGLSGAAGRIHIDDPGHPGSSGERDLTVPPMVPRAFGVRTIARDHRVAGRYGLPEAYVLSHSGGTEDAGLLLGGWMWVASAMGDAVSLVVMARGSIARHIRSRKRVSDLLASVLVLEDVRPEDMPAIYGGAEAFLFAGQHCSGEALRRALAVGLAVVGTETAQTARVMGTAGYLVPGRDARLLGAACLTVLVESEVSGCLRGEASARGAPFLEDAPLEVLLSHLERIVSTTRAVDLR